VADPRIAVVIPCFNDGETLRETLASIEEAEPIELVVVNDGSDDPGTLKVLAELEADGTRVLHQENRGLAAARMAGVAATPGWELKGGYEDWDLWMSFAERGFRGAHVPVLTGYYRVRSSRMLGETQQRHGEQFGLLRSRHPQLFAARAENRRRSAAPLRCKLLLPLVDLLPLGEYTKQRLFRAVNRPGAALRARL